MILVDSNGPSGDVVKMALTNPKHLDGGMKSSLLAEAGGDGFGEMVAEAIGRVSERQAAANDTFERMITNPDEVEIHDVTTAMATAEMGIRLTKAIVERAVKAYNDIVQMR